jgi:tripartite-type tricarboxylate transporter receptor subunit TctC
MAGLVQDISGQMLAPACHGLGVFAPRAQEVGAGPHETRPVRIIVPNEAGGVYDLANR